MIETFCTSGVARPYGSEFCGTPTLTSYPAGVSAWEVSGEALTVGLKLSVEPLRPVGARLLGGPGGGASLPRVDRERRLQRTARWWAVRRVGHEGRNRSAVRYPALLRDLIATLRVVARIARDAPERQLGPGQVEQRRDVTDRRRELIRAVVFGEVDLDGDRGDQQRGGERRHVARIRLQVEDRDPGATPWLPGERSARGRPSWGWMFFSGSCRSRCVRLPGKNAIVSDSVPGAPAVPIVMLFPPSKPSNRSVLATLIVSS